MDHTILVSSFIYLQERSFKSITQYLENARKLLEWPIPKVIFMDSALYDQFTDDSYNTFIETNAKDIYINQLDPVEWTVNSTNPSKDSIEYFTIMCNKTEWVRQATQLFPQYHQYIWIDFGIYHILPPDFNNYIPLLKQVPPNKIHIAAINPLDVPPHGDIYRDIHWYFCGGIFGGSASAVTIFADLMRSKVIELITKHRRLMWEVNIWYLLALEFPDLFDCYYCYSHTREMIERY
jgi:hypothetical protein